MGSENNITKHRGLYGFEQLGDGDPRRTVARNKWEIKALWQRSHEIIDLHVRGFKNAEIARILNIHPSTVAGNLNSELAQHKISELRRGKDDDTRMTLERIKHLTNVALDVYDDIMKNELTSEDMKEKVATNFLNNLSGLKAPTKIQSHHVSTTLSADEIAEMKARAAKEAKNIGKVIDVTEDSGYESERECSDNRSQDRDEACDNSCGESVEETSGSGGGDN